jgi:D-tyrosyl-tRNA(Tyr) deacylase
MKLIIQRVSAASVSVNGGVPRRIKKGLAVLFGMAAGDDISLCEKLAHKTANLRVFADSEGKMNLSAAELGLEVLAVPNFTLYADTKKGHRPSFIAAARPETAKPAFEFFVQKLKEQGLANVQRGEFGADMTVEIINDGPVTIVMDTREW